MKLPLYAVACAGIAAAGVTSYMQVSKHQEELDSTNQKKKKNIEVQNGYDSMTVDYEAEKKMLEDARNAYNATVADIDTMESSKLTKNRTLKELNNKIATQEEKIEEVQAAVAAVKAAFQGENVVLEEIPAYVTKLNEERKDLQNKSEALAIALEEMQKKLDANNTELADLNKRESERIASLKQNSISSLITAVNSSWGFVIIKPHSAAQINEDSQLIIVRGAQHIGRLNINAVEANRVIADIDYDSLVAGARVRPGDRVILAKANSR